MNPRSFVLAIFATAVVADQHTHNTLKHIRKATADFHNRISGWDGGYLGAARVAKHSYDLRNTLNAALEPASIDEAKIAPRSAEMEAETMEIARYLADEIGEVVDTAVEMKPKMEGIPYAGKKVGKMIFRGLHGASSNLGQEFAPRASDEHQETARSIIRDIDEHFMRGIAAFE